MGHPVLLSLALFLLLLVATSRAAAGHAAQAHAVAAITQQKEAVGSLARSMVGSRPPSCRWIRCWWCGRRGRRCEAVQVPVAPQDQQLDGGDMLHGRISSTVKKQPSSYDDHSNYKPLSWWCNCGGVLLPPCP
ncbi:hypothetical protein ACP4OV_022738 [Aristida adscensionis]